MESSSAVNITPNIYKEGAKDFASQKQQMFTC